jgi:aromatic ring-opening dioxygenase LigB subunit
MVPELLQIGSILRDWMEALPERVGVIISGDLSHTHQATGPYGYSNASTPFDNAVQNWAYHPYRFAASLLDEARLLQPRAMSCGYTGLVLLHGILNGNENWPPVDNGHVYVNRNATYYGMMAATFAAPDGAIRTN